MFEFNNYKQVIGQKPVVLDLLDVKTATFIILWRQLGSFLNSQKCQKTGFEGGGQQKSPSLTDVIFGFIACPQGKNPFTVTGNLDNN